MDSAIREGAGAPRVINAPFPTYPMVPGSQPPPGSQFFTQWNSQVWFAHGAPEEVQCLVLDFCDVKWDSGDIGWYWVTFWLITWYWQRLTLNDAAAEWHPMLNSDLEWFWASEWHCPRGRCRCWHWVTMEGKQRRSQVQRLQHIYSAPLSHRHTHTHAHSKTQANTLTHRHTHKTNYPNVQLLQHIYSAFWHSLPLLQ